MPTTQTRPSISFNAALMEIDTVRRGWTAAELAQRAGVADMTVLRFFKGQRQTLKTAKKIARALRHPLDRYLVIDEAVA